MVSQTKQVCYILLDSVFILADRCLRTLELKLSVFSWFQVFRFQVVLTKRCISPPQCNTVCYVQYDFV